MTEAVEQFLNALLSCNTAEAEAVLKENLENRSIVEFVEDVTVPALDTIGSGWDKGDYALSQVYMSGRICEDLLEKYLPTEDERRKERPKMAIALLNDYHALGKRIVYSVLRAAGYNLHDYGRMDVEELVRKAEEDQLELLLISVLMYSSAQQVAEVVEDLKERCPGIRIAVGGAPFRLDRKLWQDVGADMVGYSSTDALSIVKSHMEAEQVE